MIKQNKKVAVGMSGGVDSSVSAWLLQQQGYEVIGVFMRLGIDSAKAEDAARQVCQKLNIQFYPINLAEDFQIEVIKYFLDSYESGITPNPCVKCNKFIKFGKFFELVNQLGVDYYATGHYIKKTTKQINNKIIYKLRKGDDETKDQSYFLYNLNQEILSKVIFPLGDYKKSEIKQIAETAGLPNIKLESQDVCFLAEEGKAIEHGEYLKKKIKLIPGKIQDTKGNVLGDHQGLPLYTIGQRKGIELGGTGPYYVVGFNYKNNVLLVDNDKDSPYLYIDNFLVTDVNWISGEEVGNEFNCEVVIRYRHKPVACTVTKEKNDVYSVKLDSPQRAITAGQSAVFYNANELLGGGIIN